MSPSGDPAIVRAGIQLAPVVLFFCSLSKTRPRLPAAARLNFEPLLAARTLFPLIPEAWPPTYRRSFFPLN